MMTSSQFARPGGPTVEPKFMGQILSIACRARLKGDTLVIHVGLTMAGGVAASTKVFREKVSIEPLPPSPDGYVFLGRLVTERTEEGVFGRHTETTVFELPKSAPYRHVVLMCNEEVCTVSAVEWDGQP